MWSPDRAVYSILFVILKINRLCFSIAAVLVFTAFDNVKNVVDWHSSVQPLMEKSLFGVCG